MYIHTYVHTYIHTYIHTYPGAWDNQRKLLGDNSVVKIGVISLRWVVVAISNQMQNMCFKLVNWYMNL